MEYGQRRIGEHSASTITSLLYSKTRSQNAILNSALDFTKHQINSNGWSPFHKKLTTRIGISEVTPLAKLNQMQQKRLEMIFTEKSDLTIQLIHFFHDNIQLFGKSPEYLALFEILLFYKEFLAETVKNHPQIVKEVIGPFFCKVFEIYQDHTIVYDVLRISLLTQRLCDQLTNREIDTAPYFPQLNESTVQRLKGDVASDAWIPLLRLLPYKGMIPETTPQLLKKQIAKLICLSRFQRFAKLIQDSEIKYFEREFYWRWRETISELMKGAEFRNEICNSILEPRQLTPLNGRSLDWVEHHPVYTCDTIQIDLEQIEVISPNNTILSEAILSEASRILGANPLWEKESRQWIAKRNNLTCIFTESSDRTPSFTTTLLREQVDGTCEHFTRVQPTEDMKESLGTSYWLSDRKDDRGNTLFLKMHRFEIVAETLIHDLDEWQTNQGEFQVQMNNGPLVRFGNELLRTR